MTKRNHGKHRKRSKNKSQAATSPPRQQAISSLQKQLQNINALRTSALDLKAKRLEHGNSLIFSHTDAASQTLFDVFQICVAGFRDLCRVETSFEQFAHTIFADDSINVERSTVAPEEERRLDESLGCFMRYVGPYLKLQPARLAMEWLIRRYSVYTHNVQQLILTYLPFHDSADFVAILQMIPPKRLPSAFQFLQQFQQSPQTFQRTFLVQQCLRVPFVLKCINDYVMQTVKAGIPSPRLIPFWVDVFSQALHAALEAQGTTGDGQEARNMKHIVDYFYEIVLDVAAMDSPSDFGPACYPMLATLVSKGSLSQEKVDTLMEFVVSTMRGDSAEDAASGLKICALLARMDGKRCYNSKVLRLQKIIEPRLANHLPAIHSDVNLADLAIGISVTAIKLSGRHPRRTGKYMATLDWWLKSGFIGECNVQWMIRFFLSRLQDYEHLEVSKNTKETMERKAKRSECMCMALDSWTQDPIMNVSVSSALRDMATVKTFSIESLPLQAREPLERAQVQLQLRLAGDFEGEDDDAPMVDSDGAAQSSSTSLGNITPSMRLDPTLIPTHVSQITAAKGPFLTETTPPSYHHLVSALLKKSNEKGEIDALRTTVEFRELEDAHLMSFLVRVFSSSNLGQHAPRIALQALEGHIASLNRNDWDPQALIPYLLVALANPDARIRSASSRCLSALGDFFPKCKMGAPQHARKDLSDCGFYSKSRTPAMSMTPTTARELMKHVVIPHLACSLTDESHILDVLELAINGESITNLSNPSLNQEAGELNLTHRKSIASFLAAHAECSGLPPFQLNILKLLELADSSASTARSEHLVPMVMSWTCLSAEWAAKHASEHGFSLSDLNSALLRVASPKDEKTMKLLLALLRGEIDAERDDVQVAAFDRAKALFQHSRAPMDLITTLIDVGANVDHREAAQNRLRRAKDVLREVQIHSDDLVALLKQLPPMRGKDSADERPRKRVKTTDRRETPDDYNLFEVLNKYTLLLELVESSRSSEFVLLPQLFHLLNEFKSFDSKTGCNSDYLTLPVLRSMQRIVAKLDTTRSAVDLPLHLLVYCATEFVNQSIRNEALSLISRLVEWSPKLVLNSVHSIVPIFPTLGSTIMRNSDDYSMDLTDRIVETVIPPLIQSIKLQKSGRSVSEQALVPDEVEVFQSFVMAWPEIPETRRMGLFEHLIKTAGPDEYLYIISAMITDQHSANSAASIFVCDLIARFNVLSQLKTIRQAFDLIVDLFAPNKWAAKRTVSMSVYQSRSKTTEQLSGAVTSLLKAIQSLMTRRTLRDHVTQLLPKIREDDTDESKIVRGVIIQSIVLVHAVENGDAATRAASSAVSNQAMQMLPFEQRVRYVSVILSRQQYSDKFRAATLEMLMTQLPSPVDATFEAASSVPSILSDMCSMMQKSELASLKHIAVRLFDQVVQLYGRRDPAAVFSVAESISSDIALGSEDVLLQTLSLTTLTTCVRVLREQFLPLVPLVLDYAFENLRKCDSDIFRPTMREGVFGILLEVVAFDIAFALSDENLDAALQMCFDTTAENCPDHKESYRKRFYRDCGTRLDTRRCFEVLKRCTFHAWERGPSACEEAVKFAGYSLSEKKFKGSGIRQTVLENVRNNKDEIVEFVCSLWDVRRVTASLSSDNNPYTAKRIERLEKRVNQLAMVAFKELDIESFGCTMGELVSWVTNGQPPEREDSHMLRATSFFMFLERFMSDLEGEVTHYGDDFLSLAVWSLQSDPANRICAELIDFVLKALRAAFKNDSIGFWSGSRRFDMISTALFELIPKCAMLPLDPRGLRASSLDTVGALALAAPAEQRRTTTNKATIVLLQDDRNQVRAAGIDCQVRLLQTCGVPWLSFMPQLLPYISSLMEDDDECVEKTARVWIEELSKLKGESISAMFQ